MAHPTAVAALACLLCSTLAAALVPLGTSPSSASFLHKGFIRVQNGRFVDEECKEFYFTGWNSWATLEDATEIIKDPGASLNAAGKNKIEDMFDKAVDVGFNVVRMFAHAVKPWHRLQYSPGVYDDTVLKALDYILAEAGKRGIKVIMIPATNWGPEDSKYQFTKWDKSTIDQDEFWVKPNIKQWYKNHLYKMANRVNTYNGIQYKEDPTIFAWNIFNEFRCTKEFCWEAEISVKWTTEMAQFIKSVDPNHLVTTGQEGFYAWGCDFNSKPSPFPVFYTEGQDFIRDHSIPEIDFAVIHLWPNNWGIGPDIAFAVRWIQQHVQDTENYLKKPLVLEEFGVETQDADGDRASTRDPFFTAVINEVKASLDSGGVLRGGMFWEWFADENARLSRHGVTSRHSTWRILSDHAADIAARNAQPKDPFCRPGRESARVSSYVPNDRYDIKNCCSADCKALRGLFRGTTIKELYTADAGRCCNECKAANAAGLECVTWNWCSCSSCDGKGKGTCVLKTQENPVYPVLEQDGVGQPWIAGVPGEYKYPDWKCQPSGGCALGKQCPNFEASIQCLDTQTCVAIKGNLGPTDERLLEFSVNARKKTPLTLRNLPLVITAADCCDACKKVPECNAWRYCKNVDGCELREYPCSASLPGFRIGKQETCIGDRYPMGLCTLYQKVDWFRVNTRHVPESGFVSGYIPGREFEHVYNWNYTSVVEARASLFG